MTSALRGCLVYGVCLSLVWSIPASEIYLEVPAQLAHTKGSVSGRAGPQLPRAMPAKEYHTRHRYVDHSVTQHGATAVLIEADR